MYGTRIHISGHRFRSCRQFSFRFRLSSWRSGYLVDHRRCLHEWQDLCDAKPNLENMSLSDPLADNYITQVVRTSYHRYDRPSCFGVTIYWKRKPVARPNRANIALIITCALDNAQTTVDQSSKRIGMLRRASDGHRSGSVERPRAASPSVSRKSAACMVVRMTIAFSMWRMALIVSRPLRHTGGRQHELQPDTTPNAADHHRRREQHPSSRHRTSRRQTHAAGPNAPRG